jgi:riboflavin synthase alpha subunit
MDEWKKVYVGKVGGRSVEGDVYTTGEVRVRTTQKSDDPGSVVVDGTSTVVMTPRGAGSPITVEAETLDELETSLASDGEFSPQEAAEIVEGMRTALRT